VMTIGAIFPLSQREVGKYGRDDRDPFGGAESVTLGVGVFLPRRVDRLHHGGGAIGLRSR
jgi:hypothetical protein